MKFLVVGGASALAHALVPKLKEMGVVITAGRHGCDIYLDLSDINQTIHLPEDIDIVINLAASFGGDNYTGIQNAYRVNVLGLLNLCQACENVKVSSFINISSASAHLDNTSEYYGAYSITKNHADEISTYFCKSLSFNYTVLRPTQLYGDEDVYKKHQPFLYHVADMAESSKDIAIYGTYDAKRNYLHVDDFTKVICLLAQKPVVGVFDCMFPEDCSFTQLVKSAIQAFSSTSRYYFLADKKDIQDNIFKKDFSLYEKLNYYPITSIEKGFQRIARHRAKA